MALGSRCKGMHPDRCNETLPEVEEALVVVHEHQIAACLEDTPLDEGDRQDPRPYCAY